MEALRNDSGSAFWLDPQDAFGSGQAAQRPGSVFLESICPVEGQQGLETGVAVLAMPQYVFVSKQVAHWPGERISRISFSLCRGNTTWKPRVAVVVWLALCLRR